jgi:hypothetical protein
MKKIKGAEILDEKNINLLIKQATDQVGPYSYIGVSYRDLRRYQNFKEEGLELTKEDIQLTQLYAGLSVLSSAYFKERKTARADKFIDLIQQVHEEDVKRYHANAFPYDNEKEFPYPNELKTINSFLNENLSSEQPSLEILKHPEIRHEWTVKPGKKLFQKFLKATNRKLKKIICEKDSGLLNKVKNGGDEKDVIKEVLLVALPLLGIPWGKFLSIGVLLSTILVTRGLNLYCKGYKPSQKKSTKIKTKNKGTK